MLKSKLLLQFTKYKAPKRTTLKAQHLLQSTAKSAPQTKVRLNLKHQMNLKKVKTVKGKKLYTTDSARALKDVFTLA